MKRFIKITAILAAAFALSGAMVSCTEESLEDSELLYFSITEPYLRIGGVSCSIDRVTGVITNDEPIPADVDLSSVAAWFITDHPGKGVFVKGQQQTSGVSKQNFNNTVEYEVVSDRQTRKYKVCLTKSEDLHTQAAVKLSAYSDLVGSIEADSENWLSDGVRHSEIDFTTTDGRELRIDLIEADLTKVSMRALSPSYSFETPAEGATWPVQTILEQAQAAQDAGVKVIAAVNADFFDINATNICQGPFCINGTFIKTAFQDEELEHYFGLRKDGRASIGSYTDFQSLMDRYVEVVGGHQVLLEDDGPVAGLDNDTSIARRVGIGMNSLDLKTLYIVTVEGSTGVTFSELAACMLHFGAGHALNLDGGGSTTCVVNDKGTLKVVNRPGGTLRKVANGIAVISK